MQIRCALTAHAAGVSPRFESKHQWLCNTRQHGAYAGVILLKYRTSPVERSRSISMP